MKKALLILCVGLGAYQTYGTWKERRALHQYLAFMASEAKDRPASQAGFIDAVEPDGIDPNVMTVFMPVGCPRAAGQRGRALIEKMNASRIPATAASDAHVTLNAKSKIELEAKAELANRVMTGETPIVFFKGRAKNNPSFEEVLLEYQTSK